MALKNKIKQLEDIVVREQPDANQSFQTSTIQKPAEVKTYDDLEPEDEII